MDIFDQNHVVFDKYELLEPKNVLASRLPGLSILATGSRYSIINPLRSKNLHLRFLRTEPVPEKLLEFAHEFGMLLSPADRVATFDRGLGASESVRSWVTAWETLKLATRALQVSGEIGHDGIAEARVNWGRDRVVYTDRVGNSKIVRALSSDDVRIWRHLEHERRSEASRLVARHIAQRLCNEALKANTAAQLLGSGDDLRRPLRVFIRPLSLLGAMWLHFAQVIDDRSNVAVCRFCGNAFVADRKSAKYCPESLGTWCRKKAQRQPS